MATGSYDAKTQSFVSATGAQGAERVKEAIAFYASEPKKYGAQLARAQDFFQKNYSQPATTQGVATTAANVTPVQPPPMQEKQVLSGGPQDTKGRVIDIQQILKDSATRTSPAGQTQSPPVNTVTTNVAPVTGAAPVSKTAAVPIGKSGAVLNVPITLPNNGGDSTGYMKMDSGGGGTTFTDEKLTSRVAPGTVVHTPNAGDFTMRGEVATVIEPEKDTSDGLSEYLDSGNATDRSAEIFKQLMASMGNDKDIPLPTLKQCMDEAASYMKDEYKMRINAAVEQLNAKLMETGFYMQYPGIGEMALALNAEDASFAKDVRDFANQIYATSSDNVKYLNGLAQTRRELAVETMAKAMTMASGEAADKAQIALKLREMEQAQHQWEGEMAFSQSELDYYKERDAASNAVDMYGMNLDYQANQQDNATSASNAAMADATDRYIADSKNSNVSGTSSLNSGTDKEQVSAGTFWVEENLGKFGKWGDMRNQIIVNRNNGTMSVISANAAISQMNTLMKTGKVSPATQKAVQATDADLIGKGFKYGTTTKKQ